MPQDPMVVAAQKAAQNSYSPYSNFKVGACVKDDNGCMHVGTNVENASFGVTICAERTAIAQAITQGASKIDRVVIYTPTKTPTAPCGACRQFIKEFATDENIEVLSVCLTDIDHSTTIGELLPLSFGGKDLQEK